jgi:hypothetical protein
VPAPNTSCSAGESPGRALPKRLGKPPALLATWPLHSLLSATNRAGMQLKPDASLQAGAVSRQPCPRAAGDPCTPRHASPTASQLDTGDHAAQRPWSSRTRDLMVLHSAAIPAYALLTTTSKWQWFRIVTSHTLPSSWPSRGRTPSRTRAKPGAEFLHTVGVPQPNVAALAKLFEDKWFTAILLAAPPHVGLHTPRLRVALTRPPTASLLYTFHCPLFHVWPGSVLSHQVTKAVHKLLQPIKPTSCK